LHTVDITTAVDYTVSNPTVVVAAVVKKSLPFPSCGGQSRRVLNNYPSF